MGKIEITVRRNEEKVLPIIWINGKENEISLTARMIGEGASLRIVGLFFGTENNAVRFNTTVIHQAPKTKSMTTLRGVFQDNASINNDGMITIQKGAKGADGYFASKILLFDDAKGRSVPSLEIDENDLKAGHASTVGRPDAEQMFYLMSRGLNEKEAIQLIISGFFEPIISMLPEKKRKEVRVQLKKYLRDVEDD